MTICWRGIMKRHPRVWAGLFAAYWAVIFLLTHVQMPHVAGAPRNTDKFVHLVFYGGFAGFVSLWLSARRAWNRKLALFVFRGRGDLCRFG